MTRTIAALTCLTLLGCGREENPRAEAEAVTPPDAAPRTVAVPAEPEAPAAAAVAPERRDPFLFWGTDEAGLIYSIWVSEGAGGLERIEASGVVVASDGALWHWVEEEQPLSIALDCETLEETATGTTTGVNVFLDRVGGGARLDLLASNAMAAREAADWEESVELLGSVGPYLFVRRSVYSYHCGAHGGIEHEFFAIDVRTSNPVELVAETDREALSPMLDRARATLATETDGDSLMFGDELTHTMYWPAFEERGLHMMHQWTGEACYACSDGDWSSYTVSTQIEDAQIPAELAPHAAGIDDALRWLRAELPELTIRGVSRPKASLRDAFEELPQEGC